MLIETIMSRDPVVVTPDCTPEHALELMSEQDIRHLPVLDDGRLVGVVSDRDLLEATGGRPAAERRPETPEAVAELMATDLATLSPKDTVVSATVEFLVERIGCLPVLDEAGALVGIVTEMDMLTAYANLARGGELPEERRPAGDVDAAMTTDPLTLSPDARLDAAWALQLRRHVRHLPVLQDGALVGMLSDRDLRRAVGAGLPDETAVSEVMSNEPLHVRAGTSLREAALLMALGKVSALPVLEGDRLVGLLTLSDLLERCLASLREPEAGDAG